MLRWISIFILLRSDFSRLHSILWLPTTTINVVVEFWGLLFLLQRSNNVPLLEFFFNFRDGEFDKRSAFISRIQTFFLLLEFLQNLLRAAAAAPTDVVVGALGRIVVAVLVVTVLAAHRDDAHAGSQAVSLPVIVLVVAIVLMAVFRNNDFAVVFLNRGELPTGFVVVVANPWLSAAASKAIEHLELAHGTASGLAVVFGHRFLLAATRRSIPEDDLGVSVLPDVFRLDFCICIGRFGLEKEIFERRDFPWMFLLLLLLLLRVVSKSFRTEPHEIVLHARPRSGGASGAARNRRIWLSGGCSKLVPPPPSRRLLILTLPHNRTAGFFCTKFGRFVRNANFGKVVHAHAVVVVFFPAAAVVAAAAHHWIGTMSSGGMCEQ